MSRCSTRVFSGPVVPHSLRNVSEVLAASNPHPKITLICRYPEGPSQTPNSCPSIAPTHRRPWYPELGPVPDVRQTMGIGRAHVDVAAVVLVMLPSLIGVERDHGRRGIVVGARHPGIVERLLESVKGFRRCTT